jgi:hypothetical protein
MVGFVCGRRERAVSTFDVSVDAGQSWQTRKQYHGADLLAPAIHTAQYREY